MKPAPESMPQNETSVPGKRRLRRCRPRNTGFCMCGEPVRPKQYNCKRCHSLANKRLRLKKKKAIEDYARLKIRCSILETEVRFRRRFPLNRVRVPYEWDPWLEAQAVEFKPGDVVVIVSCADPTAKRALKIGELVDLISPESQPGSGR